MSSPFQHTSMLVWRFGDVLLQENSSVTDCTDCLSYDFYICLLVFSCLENVFIDDQKDNNHYYIEHTFCECASMPVHQTGLGAWRIALWAAHHGCCCTLRREVGQASFIAHHS